MNSPSEPPEGAKPADTWYPADTWISNFCLQNCEIITLF